MWAMGRSLLQGMRWFDPIAMSDDPPESKPMASTAPSDAIICPCSIAVYPRTPCCGPSDTTMAIEPSAIWPTAVRVVREFSWVEVNPSPESATGTPPCTIMGPPPTAPQASAVMPGMAASISTRLPFGSSFARELPEPFLPESTTCPVAIVAPPPGTWAMTVPCTLPFTVSPPAPSTATTTSCTGPVGVGAPRSGV